VGQRDDVGGALPDAVTDVLQFILRQPGGQLADEQRRCPSLEAATGRAHRRAVADQTRGHRHLRTRRALGELLDDQVMCAIKRVRWTSGGLVDANEAHDRDLVGVVVLNCGQGVRRALGDLKASVCAAEG